MAPSEISTGDESVAATALLLPESPSSPAASAAAAAAASPAAAMPCSRKGRSSSTIRSTVIASAGRALVSPSPLAMSPLIAGAPRRLALAPPNAAAAAEPAPSPLFLSAEASRLSRARRSSSSWLSFVSISRMCSSFSARSRSLSSCCAAWDRSSSLASRLSRARRSSSSWLSFDSISRMCSSFSTRSRSLSPCCSSLASSEEGSRSAASAGGGASIAQRSGFRLGIQELGFCELHCLHCFTKTPILERRPGGQPSQ